MEEGPESNGGGAFAELKACSLELLALLQNPNQKQCPALSRLLHVLRTFPPLSLQPFFDYTLFPLLLLLDAAVSCRSSQQLDSEEGSKIPGQVSDAVAEGTLQCLEELLKKCYLGSVDQVAVVLKKLTYGAMLSPSEACEEFREGVIRCFGALLFNLTPCSDNSCPCAQSFHLPLLFDSRDFQAVQARHPDNRQKPNECLLAFLQSQTASAAVGHWLSLLLSAADVEAARGHRGSAKLRVEALLTLRVLIAKVGTADALAFFLPGVVSQLAKILQVSKSMISGAAGSIEATEHAIRGLAEFLMIVLQDDANVSNSPESWNRATFFNSHENESPQSFLDELRHLRAKRQNEGEIPMGDSSIVENAANKPVFEVKRNSNSGGQIGPLHVMRTRDWIKMTSENVDKLLSMTFPYISVHAAKRVRQGLVAAVQGLLLKCSQTLKRSRVMLLECICILVCDDSEEVSLAAHGFFQKMLLSSEKHELESDFTEILNRLLDKMPKMVLGSEESLALACAQQLFAVLYYSGPQLVVDHILRSPIKASQLFDVFAVCLSQESAFVGSLDKHILSRSSSSGYLYSIAELTAGSRMAIKPAMSAPKVEASNAQNLVKEVQFSAVCAYKDYELPRMPPWFVYVGSSKLYSALARILRLLGLSLITDVRNQVSMAHIMEIPLAYLHRLVSDIRAKEYNREDWQSWYARTGSGQLVRQASTAACILNEMIYGMSDQAVDHIADAFLKSRQQLQEMRLNSEGALTQSCQAGNRVGYESPWKVCRGSIPKNQLIGCVGTILHEYTSSEIWDLPVEHKISLLQADKEVGDINKHFFHDVATLHQVLIEGIGTFSLCLQEDFVSNGFLASCLYLLLENLICSNFNARHASDAVLHKISAASGFSTVGQLVVENSDYIIDSVCRQLRHLDLNPHVPNVLAAMLSYIGVAHKILPLLEEPMRSVSSELEILGRHRHPELTTPFLKAVTEIAKVAKLEASLLAGRAESCMLHSKAKTFDLKMKIEKEKKAKKDPGDQGSSCSDSDLNMEEWEDFSFKLNDNMRYRQIVASIASSCLTAVIPLIASTKEATCLIALDIVEDGINTLGKVEESFRYEKSTKEAIEEVPCLYSFHPLKDTLDAVEGNDENRLLPAMNKIWPFLVACIRNGVSIPVRRCLSVATNVIQICGGDFFSRRFHTDGHHFWNLLSTSPFKTQPVSKFEKTPLQLLYRTPPQTPQLHSMSETSKLKVQASILNMITALSQDPKTSFALRAVFKRVSGLVVGIACSGVLGLRDSSVNALLGLASVDSDLIWLLLADIYYSMKNKDVTVNRPSDEFVELPEVLPLPQSSKNYVYVQYGGQSFGFDIDFSAVEFVFRRLHDQVFSLQTYQ